MKYRKNCLRAGFTLATLIVAILPLRAAEIVAHRGASRDAPENTVAAFELAWQKGADVIEGDFLLTADGEVVCIHDKTTGRVASENLTVGKSTLAELRRLDVGAWKHPKWAGTRIPTLEEVLKAMPTDHGRIFIEIKDTTRIVKPLAKKIRELGVEPARINIICFNKDVIVACKAAMPHIQAHWLVSGKTYRSMGPDGLIAALEKLGADGVDIQAGHDLTPELGKRLHAKNLEFHCWTVNELAMARHVVACGVDSITTDRPAFIRHGERPVVSNQHVLQHLSFDEGDDTPNRVSGISGKALSNTILNTKQALPKEGTVSLWYRPVSWYNYQSIFDNTEDPNVWELWIDKEAQLGFRTTAKDLRITYRLHKVASRDQWQHLAVTWDSKTVHLYLNGVPVRSAERKNPQAPGKGFFCLGGGHPENTQAKGAWDDVVILDTALPAAEVRTLMIDGLKGLVGKTEK